MQRLEYAHKRAGERMNRLEQELKRFNEAIAYLREHPEVEAIYELFNRAV